MQHVCCYNLYSFLLYDKTKRATAYNRDSLCNYSLRKQSARSRDRTGTGVTPLVFETNASTNSAIRAVDILFLFGRPGAKVVKDVGMYNTPTITFRRFVGAPMERVYQLSCRIGTA